MRVDTGARVMLALCAAVLVGAALSFARGVLAPVAFALFLIALAWPVQRALAARLPGALALLATLLLTLVVTAAFAAMIVWGFGRVAGWLVANAALLQSLYTGKVEWLEARGVAVAGLVANLFDVRWLLRVVGEVTAALQGLLTFTALTLLFAVLGLLEVESARGGLSALSRTRPGAGTLLRACASVSRKLRRYMLVRTAMSVVTGVAVWAFARLVGLELAAEWGVIAFVLNYVPVLGPLLATVLPTLFAIVQFGAWEPAVPIFLILYLIQFLTGSYVEPRVTGAALAVSPFVVLVAVFLWTLLWGIAGAFIGIPILIAALTLCEESAGARWVAALLSGRAAADDDAPRPAA